MIYPRGLAVDSQDYILVLDMYNNRVEVLSPTLDHIGYIALLGSDEPLVFNQPAAMHLDEQNRRLYVGEWGGGRVYVLTANVF